MSESRPLRIAIAPLAFASIAGVATAQTATPATAPPEHTLSANVGLFSEYIFRGIAQTAGKPAVQGGFDYAHASGFYAGTWASNISWLEDFGQYDRSSLEWDVYGGYKSTFAGAEDWSYDVGVYGYLYPGRRNPGVVRADTWELYGAVGWKWVTAKASYTVSSDYFGARPTGEKSQGTWYFDVSAAYPIADTGWAVVGHYGHLDVRHDGSGPLEASYDDWKLGVSYTVADGLLKAVEAGAYYSGNNATSAFYTDATGYDTAKNRGVVYVKKTF